MGRLFSSIRGSLLGLSAIVLSGCTGTSVIGSGDGGGGAGSGTASSGTASSASGSPRPTGPVDKIDLLISVDNSRSMADKQGVLSRALFDLVQSLVNPPCLDSSGVPVASQPGSGLASCPPGSVRPYAPILDIHVGVISTSLGGHGADACATQDTVCPGGTNVSNNDAGHLLSRADACGSASVPTYQDQGFLSWDPVGKQSPPGDSDVGAFAVKLTDIVLGAGQVGCGYESQFESWYRFLVDPEPYDSIGVSNGNAVPTGTDALVLQQRAAFLRPDSLLAIVMLSDENDCSIKELGTNFLAAQQRVPGDTQGKIFHLPRARQECAVDPNDPCCKSCGADAGNCPVDPTCGEPLSDAEDNVNLRCFDQKRRFGFDFLYPVDRYVTALSSPLVPNRAGDMVPNPIFSDLNPNDSNSAVRDPSRVIISGIVGVPWQDIAHDPTDLALGFKTAEELSQAQGGVTGWDVILGNPDQYVAPKDPLMIESSQLRSGVNPITGDPIATPQNPLSNPINGHDYSIPFKDDLQYSCIFQIPTPRDCSQPGIISCDCGDALNDNPLCDPANKQIQVRAKAYPGVRQLSLLKALDTRGVVSSICPSQQVDPTKLDYAYRPAVRALIDRIEPLLTSTP